MQIVTLELSENPFFFGHKSDLERKCRILLLIRDQVTLVRGEGRGERNFNRKGDKWSPKEYKEGDYGKLTRCDQVNLIVTKRQMMTLLNYRTYQLQLVNLIF